MRPVHDLPSQDPADRSAVRRMLVRGDALRLALGHLDESPEERRAACVSRCALRMESRSTPSRSRARSREHQRPATCTSVSSRDQEPPAWPRRKRWRSDCPTPRPGQSGGVSYYPREWHNDRGQVTGRRRRSASPLPTCSRRRRARAAGWLATWAKDGSSTPSPVYGTGTGKDRPHDHHHQRAARQGRRGGGSRPPSTSNTSRSRTCTPIQAIRAASRRESWRPAAAP